MSGAPSERAAEHASARAANAGATIVCVRFETSPGHENFISVPEGRRIARIAESLLCAAVSRFIRVCELGTSSQGVSDYNHLFALERYAAVGQILHQLCLNGLLMRFMPVHRIDWVCGFERCCTRTLGKGPSRLGAVRRKGPQLPTLLI